MARKREVVSELPPGVRPFTAAELAEFNTLLGQWSGYRGRGWPPQRKRLHELHAAAGRQRGFMVWELSPVETDMERALREELSGGLQ